MHEKQRYHYKPSTTVSVYHNAILFSKRKGSAAEKVKEESRHDSQHSNRKNMSESTSIKGILIKYSLQWAVVFGILYWYVDGEPEKQWYYGVAMGIYLLGLALMVAVKVLGDKAANTIAQKLNEELRTDKNDS